MTSKHLNDIKANLKGIADEVATALLGHFLGDKIRRGSIQAVKTYIQAVKAARLGLMGLIALGAVAAIFVSGIVLTIVGVVTLCPLQPWAASVILIGIGILFMAGTAFGIYGVFKEERWLEKSKSYELMDAVLAPWPGVLPPNPIDVFRNTSLGAVFLEKLEQQQVEIAQANHRAAELAAELAVVAQVVRQPVVPRAEPEDFDLHDFGFVSLNFDDGRSGAFAKPARLLCFRKLRLTNSRQVRGFIGRDVDLELRQF